MKVYTTREIHKLIRNGGWVVKSQKGDHIKYEKNGRTMVVPSTYVNRMLVQRLNKQFGLNLF